MAFVTALVVQIADAEWWNGHTGWHHHALWWIWIPLIWAPLIALAVVVLLRQRRRSSRVADPARSILAERYARGEITPDEYRERLQMLEQAERS
jgi:putative membrane protein